MRTTTRSGIRATAWAVASAGVILPSVGEAWAQQATALDRFDPAPMTGPYFAVPEVEVEGRLRPFGGASFSFAHEPLVDGGRRGRVVVVDHQATLHLDAGVELARRLLLDVSFAGIVSQGGERSSLADPPAASAVPGDLRLGARLALLAGDGWWPGAAMGVDVWLPTGRDDAYAGAGVTRVAPRLTLGTTHPRAQWSLTAAPRLLPLASEGLGGSELEVGAAGGPRFGPLWIGPEVVFRFDVDSADAQRVEGEARLGAKVELGPVLAGLAAGPGLGEGYGAPTFRVLASLAFAANAAGAEPASPTPTTPTQDDAARLTATTAARRACGEREVAAATGCLADGDADAIADDADACPTTRGIASLDAKRNGCPATADAAARGAGDAEDDCSTDGTPARATSHDGCPSTVRFDGEQIVIVQQVQFDVGAARLDPSSDVVLGAVARVLAEHHEIARLAVDGHTDGQGDAAANLVLSQRRALAVVAWLVEHGVDARRLEARGFGARRPLADDTTPEGRAKNRRVELIIRKRTPLGKAGWTDGPVE